MNNNLAYGLFQDYKFSPDGSRSGFGKLSVPAGMKPVSDFRRNSGNLLIAPFGSAGQWIEQGHEGAASSGASSSSFGEVKSLKGVKVNPNGYLSLWNGAPITKPPSWNPLLLQGQNNFVEGINSPMLQDVVSGSKWGAKKYTPISMKKKVSKRTAKMSKKQVKKSAKKSAKKSSKKN